MNNLRVISAEYIEDYKIRFVFDDQTQKVINLEGELHGEIFSPLKDKSFFRNFRLNPFTIEWPNGADFAPEFLYNYNKEYV